MNTITSRPGTKLICKLDSLTLPAWNRLMRAARRGNARLMKKAFSHLR